MTDSRPVERLLDALQRLGLRTKRVGRNKWKAQCPGHHDKNPSLSVTEDTDGKLLLHCHAGCCTEDILRKLGLEWTDLYPDAPHRKAESLRWKPPSDDTADKAYATAEEAISAYNLGSPSFVWAYEDETGNVVAKVIRWENHDDKVIRPIFRDNDGWRLRAPPEPRPLYRLPKLLAASPDVPIIVVEGEKAADAGAQCGLLTTTSFGGASAARLADWSPVSGRNVVIVPDNDDSGLAYARTVAELCWKAKARSVKVLRLAGQSTLPSQLD